MGLFSRRSKDRSSKINGGGNKPFDTASFDSEKSNRKVSSAGGTSAGTGGTSGFSAASSRFLNRSSQASVPPSPMSPMAASHLSKINLPKPPDPTLDAPGYLKSLGAVRERCQVVTNKAFRDNLNHFDVDVAKFPDVVSFVCQIIKRDYDAPFNTIPSHGRYQHFCVGGRDRIANLLATFPESVDNTEKCRRLIDLFLVSVLLDAGAGTSWSYKSSENGRIYKRSEGLAVASLEMFKTVSMSSSVCIEGGGGFFSNRLTGPFLRGRQQPLPGRQGGPAQSSSRAARHRVTVGSGQRGRRTRGQGTAVDQTRPGRVREQGVLRRGRTPGQHDWFVQIISSPL